MKDNYLTHLYTCTVYVHLNTVAHKFNIEVFRYIQCFFCSESLRSYSHIVYMYEYMYMYITVYCDEVTPIHTYQSPLQVKRELITCSHKPSLLKLIKAKRPLKSLKTE